LLFSFFSCFYFSSISMFYSFHLSPAYHCIVYVLLAYWHFSVPWSGGMFGGWWMGNNGEGSGSDLTEVLFWQLSGGTGEEKKKKKKPTKFSACTFRGHACIRTRHFPVPIRIVYI
jgi:hypothetical protein